MRKANPLTGTVSAWSKALGIEPKTISQRLTKSGIKLIPQGSYTAKQIFAALNTDRDEARTRKLRAEAALAELELKQLDATLITIAEAEKRLYAGLLLPLANELNYLPEKVAALCNPSDVSLAHKVLTDWAELTKKQLKSNYDKSTSETIN